MLCPTVPAHGGVEVSLAQFKAPWGTSVPLFINLRCITVDERYCFGTSLQVLVLDGELDCLQLVRSPSFRQGHAAHRAHMLELIVAVDQIAMGLSSIAKDDSFDRSRLEDTLLLPLWAHSRHMDVHKLPEGDQTLGEILSSNTGKGSDAVLAHHTYVDDEGAIFNKPCE